MKVTRQREGSLWHEGDIGNEAESEAKDGERYHSVPVDLVFRGKVQDG